MSEDRNLDWQSVRDNANTKAGYTETSQTIKPPNRKIGRVKGGQGTKRQEMVILPKPASPIYRDPDPITNPAHDF